MSGKSLLLSTAFLAGLCAATGSGFAQEAESPKPSREHWSFAGPFGKFDTQQLQRGYAIYRQVCSNCHSMRDVAFRNLSDPGGPEFSASQVKALAESFKIQDGPDDSGNMFERAGRPSDYFPSPFPNEQAARAANGGALPPDMSVLAKARTIEEGGLWFLTAPFTQYQEEGVDYIHGILNGYVDPPPKDFTLPDGKYYNKYFPGHAISMPPPLSDGAVTFTDGSPQTLDQYSRDIAAFLLWAAEPKLDQRKQTGFAAIVFMAIFAFLLWQVKKRVWAGLKDASGTHGVASAPLTEAKPRV
jgi:ubiquinol-cytochrome c reductase cytochrome b/c1 subunit